MEENELQAYNKAIKEKYKYHTLYKILVVILLCTTILFATLYFASGDVFSKTEVTNSVIIENEGDTNTNSVNISN